MIERPDVPRSKFVGSWTRKMSFDQGKLYPFMVEEVLPGDHLRYDATVYCRMATPLFPVMDNLRLDTHFFFVPNRIVWSNWVRFMGEQDNPGDTIAYTVPVVNPPNAGFVVAELADYMGLPTTVQNNGAEVISVNALPFRAYNKIWNSWFRDENLDTGAFDYTGDAAQGIANYPLRARAKSHDYFTSCLPWPQKFTAPAIPLGTQAPVRGIGSPTSGVPGTHGGNVNDVNLGTVRNFASAWSTATAVADDVWFDTANGVYADLSAASGVAINTLRQAFLVQQLLERDARGGTRYTEIVRSHFGVTSPDARLQRPEYLGGGQTAVVVTPIAQTAPTAGVPLGALGGAATATGNHRASYAATEHGHIIGVLSVRSELSYMQGIRKLWHRSTRYDFYWPALAGLGEQAVLLKELYWINAAAADNVVFGYQERWQEYRTRVSEVAGLFRGGKNTGGALDPWILTQRFTVAPALGTTFIQDTAPMSRVLAAGAGAVNQQFFADILINREAVRPLPMYGTPVLLGRF
nr:MAG: major capsid protein [Microvirus sp.]